LNNLANVYRTRYDLTGKIVNLNQAHTYMKEALGFAQPGDIYRTASLINLAYVLQIRFQALGNESDLNQASKYNEEALKLCHPGHSDRYYALLSVADSASIRFERAGNTADAKTAVRYTRAALELRPVGHPERPTALNKYGHALRVDRNRPGGLGTDLTRAIAYHREAVGLCRVGEVRSSVLFGLGKALQAKWDWAKRRDDNDLNEAISYYAQALELRPPGHAKRTAVLWALASALKSRYSRDTTRNSIDLPRSIAYADEASRGYSQGMLTEDEEVHTTTEAWSKFHPSTSDLLKLEEYGNAGGVSPWSSVASL